MNIKIFLGIFTFILAALFLGGIKGTELFDGSAEIDQLPQLEVIRISTYEDWLILDERVHWFDNENFGYLGVKDGHVEKALIIYNTSNGKHRIATKNVGLSNCVNSKNTIIDVIKSKAGELSAFEWSFLTNDTATVEIEKYLSCKMKYARMNSKIEKIYGSRANFLETNDTKWVVGLEQSNLIKKILLMDDEANILKEWILEDPINTYYSSPTRNYDYNNNVFSFFFKFTYLPDSRDPIFTKMQEETAGQSFITLRLNEDLKLQVVPWGTFTEAIASQVVQTKRGLVGLLYVLDGSNKLSSNSGIYTELSSWKRVHQSNPTPSTLSASPDGCKVSWFELPFEKKTGPSELVMANFC